MSMTTIRVTVPVDMNCPKCGARSGDDWEQCGGRCPMPGSPHYSTAPAPEGGAVDDLRRLLGDAICYGCSRRYGDNSEAAIKDARGCVSCKAARSALATREEAPAEAGDLAGALEFLDGAAVMLGRGEMPAPGSEYAARWWQAHAVALSALRAQPPAREDAQPDAGARLARAMWGVDLVPAAHPAPDALRVAVEALEKTRDRIQQWPIDDHETCMCGSAIEAHDIGSGHSPVSQANHAISIIVEEINQALAALQAEQKGGA